jgi:hypothetical protein
MNNASRYNTPLFDDGLCLTILGVEHRNIKQCAEFDQRPYCGQPNCDR